MSRTPSAGFSEPGKRDAAEVLGFWLGDPMDPDNVRRRGKFWFAATRAQDHVIRERFGVLHERAQRGELEHWIGEASTTLALVVLLDQFTRNLYRGSASALANDERARAVARIGIDRGYDRSLHVVERAFLYMPFQHSEDRNDQRRSVQLFDELARHSPASFKSFTEESHEHAVLHCRIIERFGRFPHRNALLGRCSTAPEQQYLDQGGRRFGQG